MGDIRGSAPTAPMGNTQFPFPQNRLKDTCLYPQSAANGDVLATYARWKSLLVTDAGAGGALRVQRDAVNLRDTVSEGIAYGMLIAVYMGEQPLFDSLWTYAQAHFDGKGLMNWQINADGTVKGRGSATDADEDMAWALLMADKQWPGGSYLASAKTMIDNMWLYDVDHARGEMVKGGDNWGDDKTNPSYFAPAYYRVFGTVSDHAADWNKVVDSSYTILASVLTHGNEQNGLVPDWCSSSGAPDATQGGYSYDACRTPFRIALDACWFAEPRALAHLAKTTQFFSGIGAARVTDGYSLAGAQISRNPSVAFIGPAAVGGMSVTTNPMFLEDAYRQTATRARNDNQYYSSSWGAMSLLMMTGNFLNYLEY